MNNKEKNFVSAVIYVHNAENRIAEFLTTIANVFSNTFENSEIICVNDFSTDDSVKIIKEVSENISDVSTTIVNMSYYHGLEAAMNAGTDMAIGDFVYEFDNTVLDFESKLITDIYKKALEGYDVVSASIDKREKFTSRLFYSVFKKFNRLSYSMNTESFRILSRRVINRIKSMNKSVTYRKAAYANSGLKTFNLKYNEDKTARFKKDKHEKSYRSKLAIDSLLIFTEFGYRVSMLMTKIMIFVSVFMIVYSIIVYMSSHPVEGWMTTILFLSVAFLGLFAILTIIVKYLQLTLDFIYKRKHYSFESIEKITKQ